jgi:hypothetical protein
MTRPGRKNTKGSITCGCRTRSLSEKHSRITHP